MIGTFFKFNLLIISAYIVYVLVVTSISQIIFPYHANGSIITNDSIVVGSNILGQEFESPNYFKSRISSNPYYDSMNKTSYSQELNTLSASKLDPLVSRLNAFSQTLRIANERNVNPARIKGLVDKYSKKNIYSKKRVVNTVELNLAINQFFGD